MLTSYRGLAAHTLRLAAVLGLASAGSAAMAQVVLPPDEAEATAEPESPITLSANVALTSEYRFRGVDLSGGNMAIQGGFDLSTAPGFYVGTWASSLDEDTVGYGSTELDVYGGWRGNLTDALAFDVGVIGYLYPDAGPGDFDYLEVYGKGTFSVGPASTTVGIAYAPEQDSLGGTDNFYVYGDVGFGIPGTPVSLTGHLGYTDGFLTYTENGKALDWAVTAKTALYGPVSASVAYVGAEGDIPAGNYNFVDDAIVLTLSAAF